MIAKRFVESVRERNWGTIFLELSVVVLGVFLGIEVSNANTARQERILEAHYAERIVSELGNILETAKSQRAFEQRKIEQIREATALTRQPPSEEKALRLGTILSAISIRRSPNYESPTLNELQSSGRFGLFRDRNLRNDLSVFFTIVHFRGGVIGRNNDKLVEEYLDFLRDNAIGTAFASSEIYPEAGLAEIDRAIADASRKTFGERRMGEHSGVLMTTPTDPFWERLRAELTWRGVAAVANDFQLVQLIAEAEALRAEIEGAELD